MHFAIFGCVLNLVDSITYAKQKSMHRLNQAMLYKVTRKAVTRIYKFGNCEFEYLCYVISEDGILCLICLVGECWITCWPHHQCKTFKYFQGHMWNEWKFLQWLADILFLYHFPANFSVCQEPCFVNVYCSCIWLVGTLFTIAEWETKCVNQFRPFTSGSMWLLVL